MISNGTTCWSCTAFLEYSTVGQEKAVKEVMGKRPDSGYRSTDTNIRRQLR